MDIDLFNFDLPERLIAQSPEEHRDNCRLLAINKKTETYEDRHFFDILDYLKPGDVLVRNNTKVIAARLLGYKEETHAHVELLLLKDLGHDVWECLVGNAKPVKVGSHLVFGEKKELLGECVATFDEGIRHIKFTYSGIFFEVLDQIGLMPLPPYIKKQCDDNNKYQTVYAKVEGSAAAPTAGFHFTEELLTKIKNMGIEILDITLNIGLGTFRPVKVHDIKDHIMHSEEYEISPEVAEKLNEYKSEGRRIVAVGTTTTRTLEANFTKYNKFVATRESTNIFICPGYKFKAIDVLITNFHLPKSTLIMLVSSFSNREFILKCYKHAIEENYRFFSFGDAMILYE